MFFLPNKRKCPFGGTLARKGNAASSCSIGHDATSAAENAFHATAARQIHFVLFQGCTLDFRVFLFQTFIRIMQKIEDPIRIPEYVPRLTNPRYSSILQSLTQVFFQGIFSLGASMARARRPSWPTWMTRHSSPF